MLAAELAHELLDEAGDVLAPLTQAREVDAQHVEPMIQIAAELAQLHLLAQIPIGRGDDADVHPEKVLAADPPELPLLEYPQQLGLRRQRHLADLVEEDGPAVGQLEEAFSEG